MRSNKAEIKCPECGRKIPPETGNLLRKVVKCSKCGMTIRLGSETETSSLSPRSAALSREVSPSANPAPLRAVASPPPAPAAPVPSPLRPAPEERSAAPPPPSPPVAEKSPAPLSAEKTPPPEMGAVEPAVKPVPVEPAAVRGLARLEMGFADLDPPSAAAAGGEIEEEDKAPLVGSSPPSGEEGAGGADEGEPELVIAEADAPRESAAPSTPNPMATIVAQIDGQFGAGYAQNHPELIGPLLQAALADTTNQQILRRLDEIDRRLLRLEETLVRLPH
ncbi:hypothetical protein DSOUD_3057 [Desulfuromonas soudanensis]|uniref:Uncharacterized protein n=1 Tax=Desulfuromonas soudanensis TaxID=1603606 RepID=A0A0M3QGG6_9BACT|nr:hypothetical protein [Desulfuromonas soudanensis]ALC17783.1 hypothetical protein DSOUD_3057 [Desulfuromonas soudanensis]